MFTIILHILFFCCFLEIKNDAESHSNFAEKKNVFWLPVIYKGIEVGQRQNLKTTYLFLNYQCFIDCYWIFYIFVLSVTMSSYGWVEDWGRNWPGKKFCVC